MNKDTSPPSSPPSLPIADKDEHYTTRSWLFLWVWWVILNTLAWSFSLATGTFGLLLIGFIVGFAQWVVIRHVLPRGIVWVAATGMSLGLAFPLSLLLFVVLDAERALSAGAVTGVVMGVAQRLALHRHFIHARWWTLASIVATAVGVQAGFTMLYDVFGVMTPITKAVSGAVIGSVYGSITGGVLVWLLCHRMQHGKPDPELVEL